MPHNCELIIILRIAEVAGVIHLEHSNSDVFCGNS